MDAVEAVQSQLRVQDFNGYVIYTHCYNWRLSVWKKICLRHVLALVVTQKTRGVLRLLLLLLFWYPRQELPSLYIHIYIYIMRTIANVSGIA